jgi:peroxiredoxin
MSDMGRIRFVPVLLFCLLPLRALPVVFSGQAPSYAGTRLEFFVSTDWFTGSETSLGSCDVDTSGNFTLTADISETRQVILPLGPFRGYFFAEPGKEYHLVLPEKEELAPEDRLNPYFSADEIHLGLTNFSQDDLNMLIVMFNDAYVPYYEKHVNNVYAKTDMAKLEADITSMEAPFAKYNNAYFRAYRNYRYGMLKMLANQQKARSLSETYFAGKPVYYANPAYGDLFNQVFDKYLLYLSRTETGKQIYTDINQLASYHALKQTLAKTGGFGSDSLNELIVLKQLHDEFYGNQFSRQGILKILDSLEADTHIAVHRDIAASIRSKITRLLAGYPPPAFTLSDTKGNTVNLADYRGKYVYLNFCTCQSYACLNEFNLLAALQQRFGAKLTILTIATDPMDAVLSQFLAKNRYSWTFLLYDRQPGILKDYDIRAFPTYFLIGPDGKLIWSPAPSPGEDVESKLFELMRNRGDL